MTQLVDRLWKRLDDQRLEYNMLYEPITLNYTIGHLVYAVLQPKSGFGDYVKDAEVRNTIRLGSEALVEFDLRRLFSTIDVLVKGTVGIMPLLLHCGAKFHQIIGHRLICGL